MLRVNVYGASGAADQGFSSTPHSMARPHMFSSIEYSFSFDAEIGISHLSASSMQSARVRPHTRTGAMTSRSGARMRDDTSKRTWSLPLPVQPWPTASAPWRRADATRCSTMTGRESADTRGYLPS